jgi:hypothetical protein
VCGGFAVGAVALVATALVTASIAEAAPRCDRVTARRVAKISRVFDGLLRDNANRLRSLVRQYQRTRSASRRAAIERQGKYQAALGLSATDRWIRWMTRMVPRFRSCRPVYQPLRRLLNQARRIRSRTLWPAIVKMIPNARARSRLLSRASRDLSRALAQNSPRARRHRRTRGHRVPVAAQQLILNARRQSANAWRQVHDIMRPNSSYSVWSN